MVIDYVPDVYAGRFSKLAVFQQVVVLILTKVMRLKGIFFDRFVSLVSSVFQPFLGPLAASGDYQRDDCYHGNLWLVSCNESYVCHLECSRNGFFQFLRNLSTLTSARRFRVNGVYMCDCSGMFILILPRW